MGYTNGRDAGSIERYTQSIENIIIKHTHTFVHTHIHTYKNTQPIICTRYIVIIIKFHLNVVFFNCTSKFLNECNHDIFEKVFSLGKIANTT